MKKILLLLLIAPLLAFGQNSQKAVDSLHSVLSKRNGKEKCEVLNELSDKFVDIDPQKGIGYADQAMKLSVSIDYAHGQAMGWLNKGKNLSVLGENDQSLACYAKAGKLFRQLGDQCSLGVNFLNTGNSYGRSGKFPDALDAFLNALRSLDKCHDENTNLNMANCYQNIANVYNATENYDKALANYDKAIALFEKIRGEEVSLAMNLASKGMVYNKQNKNAKSLEIYKIAEKKLVALHEEVPLAYLRSWMATAYLDFGQYDQSLASSKSAFNTISNIGDQDLMASTIQNIGFAYLKKGKATKNPKDLQLAYENLQKALAMHLEQQNNERLIQDYKHLSDYYAATGDYKNGLESHILYSVYVDSVFNFKKKQSLQNLEDQRTIELRDKQLELNRLTLESKERQKWLYIIGILGLLLIAGLVFRQSQSRKKINTKLKKLNEDLDRANKTKARFFSILNHDLRTPVSNLIHFLHLQTDNPELLTEDSRHRMQAKTTSAVENLLGSMEDMLLWSKGQMENFSPELKKVPAAAIFNDLQKHFSSTENVRIDFETGENPILLTDENYLKTILRNIIGNAVAALGKTENARVTVQAGGGDHPFISVSDNGPGAAQEQFRALYDDKEVIGIGSGLGLHLVRDLAKVIGCAVSVESKPGSGAIFTLTF